MDADAVVGAVVGGRVDASASRDAVADARLSEFLVHAGVALPGLGDVLRASLREICLLTGWALGQAWLPDPAGGVLRCRYAWHEGPPEPVGFHDTCRTRDLPIGKGLPGWVWSSRQWGWGAGGSVWSAHALDDAGGAVPPDPVQGAQHDNVAIPVLAGGAVVAVLQFLVADVGIQDARSLARVAAVADRIGPWMVTKNADDERVRTGRQFRRLADTAADAIVSADADRCIIYLNASAERMFGYSADEVVGHPLAELVHERSDSDSPSELDYYAQVGCDGVMGPVVYLAAVGKDGCEFPVEMTITEWKQSGATFVTAIVRDASNRVEVERRLEDLLEQEQDTVARLNVEDGLNYTVLQTVAHDLRSPMAAVSMLCALLKTFADADAAADQASVGEVGAERVAPQIRTKLLGDIERNVDKMKRLLRDLINSDPSLPLEARRARCDIGELVGQTLTHADVGRLHPIHTRLDSVAVSVDAAQVERIVDNLLSNAAKHVPAGVPIWVETAAVGPGALITVEDAGRGVPADLQEKIFDSFRRGDGPTSPGLGLGLSLVARYALIHGGRAWVEDRAGGGSSFRVYLPDVPAGFGRVTG